MDVSRAAIRWAICWCLLFTVIPVGYVSSQTVEKSQAVTGKIILPEEIARFLGAPPPATRGGDGKQAAENQAQTPPAASGTALNDAPAAGPQAVRGKITTSPSMEKSPAGGEVSAPLPAVPALPPTGARPDTRAEASPPAGDGSQQPPAVLPSLFAADKDRLKDAYSYSPAGKIDPFEPLFRAKPEESEKAKKKKRPKRVPRTPLEMVDISQLNLSAIINAASGNRALVEEASGKGYVVREGTPIGIHWGKVTAIKKDRVVVEEEVEDLMGDYVKRNREMKLNKPIGE